MFDRWILGNRKDNYEAGPREGGHHHSPCRGPPRAVKLGMLVLFVVLALHFCFLGKLKKALEKLEALTAEDQPKAAPKECPVVVAPVASAPESFDYSICEHDEPI